MCYHYSLTAEAIDLNVRFDAEIIAEYDAIYHNDGFSHRAMPIITADEPDKIQFYEWGLIPHWFSPKPGLLDKAGRSVTALQ